MNNNLHLAVLGSLHYYSRSLGDVGRGYHLKEQASCRCFAESGAIIDSVFSKIANDENIDAVIITGSLTNNNELVSHKEIREKLYNLQKNKPVYVLSADKFDNEFTERFLGNRSFKDVPALKADEIESFYKDFGLEISASSFKGSYCAEIAPGQKLLALNGYDEESVKWAESELKTANEKDENVIILEKGFLSPHVSPIVDGEIIENGAEIAKTLGDNGAKLIFTGHAPNQSSSKLGSLNEFNVGSVSCYPSPIIHCLVNENEISVKTETLESFTLEGETINAENFLKNHLTDIITKIVKPGSHGDALEFLDRAAALGFKIKRKRFYFPIFPVVYSFSKAKIGSFAPFNTALTKEEKNLSLTAAAEKIIINLFNSSESISPALSAALNDVSRFSSRVINLISKSENNLKSIESLVKSAMLQDESNRTLNIKK